MNFLNIYLKVNQFKKFLVKSFSVQSEQLGDRFRSLIMKHRQSLGVEGYQ